MLLTSSLSRNTLCCLGNKSYRYSWIFFRLSKELLETDLLRVTKVEYSDMIKVYKKSMIEFLHKNIAIKGIINCLGRNTMKTFTVTYHHTHNYGALLQAYALQQAIFTLGHENIIFEYPERSSIYQKLPRRSLLSTVKTAYINYLTFIRRNHIQRLDYSFKKFRKEKLTLSRRYNSMQDLKENPPDADCFIVGSDQVWNLKTKSEFIPARLLDFGNPNAVRFSYGASIETMNYTDEQKELLKNSLVNFKGISLREESACDYIESFTAYRCHKVLDPVFLLKVADWSKIISEPRIKPPYILCYQVQRNKRMQEVVDKLKEETGFPVVAVCCSAIKWIKADYTIFDASPEEFLGLYKKASIVATASFHGTAFGLVFNKPVYSLVKHPGSNRIKDLLHSFGLYRFIIDKNSEIPSPIVDYPKVNQIIEKEREFSIGFLKRMFAVEKSFEI